MCMKEGLALAPKEINKKESSFAKQLLLERRITKLYFEPANIHHQKENGMQVTTLVLVI